MNKMYLVIGDIITQQEDNMNILGALKKIKHLDRKIEKTLKRIMDWSSYILEEGDEDTPLYNEGDMRTMSQSVEDMTNEKARIRHLLHKTNMNTTVEFEGKERTIDELLILQNIILPGKIALQNYFNRKEKGHSYHHEHDKNAKVVMQYDPKKKAAAIDGIEYRAEQLNEFLDNVSITVDVIDW